MPRYLIAFPVYNAFFEIDEMSFKVADVTFMSKASLSKEIPYTKGTVLLIFGRHQGQL